MTKLKKVKTGRPVTINVVDLYNKVIAWRKMKYSVDSICDELSISKTTYYRLLNKKYEELQGDK